MGTQINTMQQKCVQKTDKLTFGDKIALVPYTQLK